jgi:protein-S-isoprenylcysteine O-methyltransferase Ste14
MSSLQTSAISLPVLEPEFRIAVAILLAILVLVRVHYHVRAARIAVSIEKFEGKWNLAFRLTGALLLVISLAAWFAHAAWLERTSVPFPPWLRWLGAPIGAVGLAGLFDVHRTLGRNFSGTLHLLADHELVVTGPYRYVRHPMYTAFYLILFAIALLSANWLLGGGMLLGLTAVMLSRVKHEEEVMTGRFGRRYIDYMARTGRFLPRL